MKALLFFLFFFVFCFYGCVSRRAVSCTLLCECVRVGDALLSNTFHHVTPKELKHGGKKGPCLVLCVRRDLIVSDDLQNWSPCIPLILSGTLPRGCFVHKNHCDLKGEL